MTQLLLFVPLFFMALFLLGALIQKLLKLEPSVSGALCFGLVGCLSLFQYIAYPLYLADSSLTVLIWCFSIPAGLLLLWSLRNLIRGDLRCYGNSISLFFQRCREMPALMLVIAAGLAVYFLCALGFPYGNSDDTYYMSRATLVWQENSLQLPPALIWLGQLDAVWPPDSDASTLEFFKAYLSALSGIDVVVLCRNGLNAAFSVVSLAAFWNLAGDLTGDRPEKFKVQCITLFAHCVFTFMGAFGVDTSPNWILRSIWQGKALICGVVLPMLMSGCVRILRYDQEDVPALCWVQTGLVLTAGVSVSIVGVYLPFLCYFCLGFPYLIRRGWKKGAALIGPILLSSISVILFGGLVLLDVTTVNTKYFETYRAPDWFETFQYTLGFCRYLFLGIYLLAVTVMLRRGDWVEKILLCAAPLVLFVTFLNPLLTVPVSRYITTRSVYWRLYWILPVWFLPAYVIARALASQSEEKLNTIFLSATVTICSCLLMLLFLAGPNKVYGVIYGAYCEKAGVTMRTELTGMTPDARNVAQAILNDHAEGDNPRLMMPPDNHIINHVRQSSVDIHLINGIRRSNLRYLPQMIPDGTQSLGEFLGEFYDGNITDSEQLREVLAFTDTDYVCLPSTFQTQLLEDAGCVLMTEIGKWKWTLWRVE